MKYQTIAPHRRLVTKFAAMAVFLSLIPQVVIYLLASQTTSSVLLETLRTSLEEKSFLVGAGIDRFFLQRERDVRILSQADVLEGSNLDAIIQYLTEVIEETPYLDDIDIIDTDGIIVASSGEQNERGEHVLTQRPSLESVFSAVTSARQGEVFVSHVLDLDKGPGLAFLTPITDESNLVVVRIMLVEVNLDIVASIVADFDARVIGDKYVYLVDNDGTLLWSIPVENATKEHADNINPVDLDGDGKIEIAYSGSKDFFVANTQGEVIWRRPHEHSQNTTTGRFRDDVDGLTTILNEKWIGMTCYTPDGRALWQKPGVGYARQVVRGWREDGLDLVIYGPSLKKQHEEVPYDSVPEDTKNYWPFLMDGDGNRVMEFPFKEDYNQPRQKIRGFRAYDYGIG